MLPSRRQLLRASALSIAGIAGCAESGEPTTSEASTTRTTRRTTTSTPTETTTTREPSPLRCTPGALPERGWPLADRSPGRTNYASDADGPTTAPGTEWSVKASEAEEGWVQFTRPTVADGTVYVGRRVATGPERPKPDQQYVHAYDAATGDKQWHAPISGTPCTPAVADGTVFVHDETTLYAFDAAGGEETWTHDTDGVVESVLPTAEWILVASTFADADDEVVALTPAGRVAWRVAVPSYHASQLAWSEGMVYLVDTDAVLVAIDADEAAVTWKRNLQDGGDRAPAVLVATPCAVFAVVDGVYYAVNRSGELAWSKDVGGRELATDGDALYGVDADGYVRALDVADGSERWEVFHGVEEERQTDGFYVDPAVGAGTLYAGTLDGKLVAVSTADGSERWVIERDWEESAGVSVVDDTLYAGWGRHLAAFR